MVNVEVAVQSFHACPSGGETTVPVPSLWTSQVEHDEHVPPKSPQSPAVWFAYAMQAPAAVQHPAGQVLASHSQTPTVVSQSPSVHDVQAAPPVPHWPGVSEA